MIGSYHEKNGIHILSFSIKPSSRATTVLARFVPKTEMYSECHRLSVAAILLLKRWFCMRTLPWRTFSTYSVSSSRCARTDVTSLTSTSFTNNKWMRSFDPSSAHCTPSSRKTTTGCFSEMIWKKALQKTLNRANEETAFVPVPVALPTSPVSWYFRVSW